jgi:hypothetical protein
MRLVFHLLCSVTLLAANSVEAQSRRASDWQVFKVPDYGTRLEYPASIFSAAGQGETVVGQRFEMRMVGQCCPSTPARMKTAIHPRVIPRRICGNRDHNTNGSLVCDFDGAGRDNSLQPLQFLALCSARHPLLRFSVSTSRKACLGSRGDAHQSLATPPRTMRLRSWDHREPSPRSGDPERAIL